MASHVEQAIAARIAAVRARRAQEAAGRAVFAERRAYGLIQGHAAKLRHLADRARVEPSPGASDDGRAAHQERTTTMPEPLPSRAECIAAARAVREEAMYRAARILRAGCDAMDRMSVADAARACYTPGGPSLAELEQRITADRAARTIVDRHQDPSGTADE